jgi:type IV pilus biogenesis protein CpaD/CtpE
MASPTHDGATIRMRSAMTSARCTGCGRHDRPGARSET